MCRTMTMLIGLLGVVVSSPAVQAQNFDWVASALPERAYDFGTVARGSQLRHAFPLVNRSDQEIRIADTRTKCGCTNVRIGAKVIPPGTQTTIEATIDTTKFLGYKPSGLTVIFDRPAFVRVDLNLTCFIRGDIVMTPGQVDFGIVRRSDKMPPATLTLTYAGGRSDWEVTKMKTVSSKVKAELRELSRTADGQINYSLTATLQPGVSNGYFKDEITLLTNDQTSPSIPISVVANIQSAVAVLSLDHQLRRLAARSIRIQDRAGSFRATVLDHQAFHQRRGSSGQRRRQNTTSRPPVETGFQSPGADRTQPRDAEHRDRYQG